MAKPELTACLNYLIPTGERPIYFASRGGAEAALKIGAEFESRQVSIGNARALQPPPELQREGFCLREHPADEFDFYQLGDQLPAYEAQIIRLVLEASGGREALVFDHTLRSDSPSIRGQRNTREPAAVIHNDYSDASAQRRLSDLLPRVATEYRLQRRFAIVNAWRSIVGTVWNSPLACCDGRTLAREDLVAAERRAEDRIGELELVSWNPRHNWYYFPEMGEDEVLLIKTFDSDPGEGAARSAHSAFDNPLAPSDAAPRESMESRLLVFY